CGRCCAAFHPMMWGVPSQTKAGCTGAITEAYSTARPAQHIGKTGRGVTLPVVFVKSVIKSKPQREGRGWDREIDPGRHQSWRWPGVLVSLALLLPARSADGKKSLLPFGRRGGIASGLLNAPRLSSFLLGFAGGLSRSLGSFRSHSLCGFVCYCLASDPL